MRPNSSSLYEMLSKWPTHWAPPKLVNDIEGCTIPKTRTQALVSETIGCRCLGVKLKRKKIA
ncbi:unnamed protein product [Clonostachys solani]|uniref:Uncharacterized protein n=1 Tax=Clonostachys solani TaxID=160281 RepID=A0A9N9ZJS1_9HYPO|nr:unnamed protein product [Clonostachys solani]